MDLDGFWWCTPPCREEVRFRRRGNDYFLQLTCEHGTYDNLKSAREDHGLTLGSSRPEITS